jgi:hypothetical protein
MAEERLSAERKSTAFWRRQAQAAEEEAGSLKTRSAAAEIQQAVMVEELASEKRRAARMFASLKDSSGMGTNHTPIGWTTHLVLLRADVYLDEWRRGSRDVSRCLAMSRKISPCLSDVSQCLAMSRVTICPLLSAI